MSAVRFIIVCSVVFKVACLIYAVTCADTDHDLDVKTEDASRLKLVTAVFRHGQRTPSSTYPTDPHIDNDFFPIGGWGSLTNEGKMQQYELGRFLRTRYKNFLSDVYSPDFVIGHCTDVDRTKMGLQLVFAGLYPPTKVQKWNSLLDWQPIPIHYEPRNEDKMLLVTIPCPRYYEAMEEVTKLDSVKEEMEKNKEIYHYITFNSGMDVGTFDDLLSLYGTLRAESDLNLTLPEWTTKVYPEPLTKLAARSFIHNDYTNELRRIKGGPLLKKILQTCTDKANNVLKPKQRQLVLYGGHDSTVAHLLSALNIWDEQIPEYNSLILLELHQLDQNLHGIKVLFRNTSELEPYVLKIPGCEEICPLEQIFMLTDDIIPEDLERECQPKDPNYIPSKIPEI